MSIPDRHSEPVDIETARKNLRCLYFPWFGAELNTLRQNIDSMYGLNYSNRFDKVHQCFRAIEHIESQMEAWTRTMQGWTEAVTGLLEFALEEVREVRYQVDTIEDGH